MVKAELYAVMQLIKSKHKCYVTANFSRDNTVFRIPLYCPDSDVTSVLVRCILLSHANSIGWYSTVYHLKMVLEPKHVVAVTTRRRKLVALTVWQ
jgi:hypothetical protein